MAGGLIALLDDVAALARLAAASADDVAAAAGRAGTKAVGVVIDDAAVTPGYVVGLPPERELPIIGKIALGSLRNKLLLILPVAMLLSAFAPWALTPILMAGGLFLCFEGAEKIAHALAHDDHPDAELAGITDPAELEKRQVAGAVRTDLILSAEIMVITLNQLTDSPLVTQAVALAVVGIAITIGVYGLVGLIVKMDDIGLGLVRTGRARRLGRGLVKAMPVVLGVLAKVGTAAMLWVGGGLLIHGAATLGWHWPEEAIHHLAGAIGGGAALAWILNALVSALVGLVAGGVIVGLLKLKPGPRAH